MRPGRFHPGNCAETCGDVSILTRFNEAGAFPPRKLRLHQLSNSFKKERFNEAGAFPPRKL